MHVRDLMTKEPVTIDPEASLRTASERMRAAGIHHLPVVAESGSLIGILTDRDLRHAALAPALAEHAAWDARRLKAPRVRDAMTWTVVATQPDATLVEAGLLMLEHRIGSLPVVAEGRLIGIVTERDLLRALRPDIDVEAGLFLQHRAGAT